MSPASTKTTGAVKAAPRGAKVRVPPALLGPVERFSMVQEAAYFRSLARGFDGGSPELDWAEAEAEIDRQLSGRGAAAP